LQKLIAKTSVAAATIAIFLSSCSSQPSKITQCNSLSTLVNQAAAAEKDFETAGKKYAGSQETKDLDKKYQLVTELVTKLESASKSVKALTVQDEKLQTMKTNIAQVYQDLAKGFSAVVTASKSRNAAAAQLAVKEMTTAADKEKALVAEMNTYCGAK
jgi:ABC-type phosphate transport system auxiliary subunit